MNFAHIHLLLNHIPVIGTIIGFCLFVTSFLGKNNNDLRRSSLIVFAVVALLTIPTFLIGFGAQAEIKGLAGVSDALMVRHEGAAMLSLWFMLGTGALALAGLWSTQRATRPARWNLLAILFFSLVTVVLMARTGNTGGDIRHPEIREGAEPTATIMAEGRIGSILHVFEPNPEKFTEAMISSKWWWAFLMGLHYVGLALLIGTVGILDLRIMGFAKQLPVAPLHGLVPWALAGFGINVVTGLLAFIGMPLSYTYALVFWLKMSALLLLGLNAAVFYLMGVFDRVELLGSGEDAPPFAKFIAGSSLFLWFAVIVLGRYIQLLEGTISSASK